MQLSMIKHISHLLFGCVRVVCGGSSHQLPSDIKHWVFFSVTSLMFHQDYSTLHLPVIKSHKFPSHCISNMYILYILPKDSHLFIHKICKVSCNRGRVQILICYINVCCIFIICHTASR